MKMLDLIIKNARAEHYDHLIHIGVLNGKIDQIHSDLKTLDSAKETYDAGGHFICNGFYESHIHLDKACILDRCNIEEGTLDEAVSETGAAKKDFTEEDVYRRASRVVEMAIKKGTMGLRTFVETDPKTGMRSFNALTNVIKDYAFAIDIEICAFAQEGLTGELETYQLLHKALAEGAHLIGGCPYKDQDPDNHIEMIFDLAQQFDVDVDFHLDFDLVPEHSTIPKLVEETLKRSYQHRVSIGHVTKLSAMSPAKRDKMISLLKEAAITLTVLPATDIFLNGRNYEKLIPRGMVNANLLLDQGVNATLSSNNILNAFTPYGDASLVRMANMYANLAQCAKDSEIRQVYEMITRNAAMLFKKQNEIKPGYPANFVVLEAENAIDAIRTVAQPLAGFKAGRQSFSNEKAVLYFN